MLTSNRLRPFLPLLFVLASSTIHAQVYQPRLRPETRPWSTNVIVPQSRAFASYSAPAVRLTGVRASITVVDGMATTTLEVALDNPHPRQLEAELLVPVPHSAVVRGFAFQGPAPEPTATLLPAPEAREAYDAIVARSRDPALLEFIGANLIRSSVFPVPAHGRQRVRLTYEQLLPSHGSRVDYLLPRTEALEYDVPWKISITITSQRPVSTVYSPTHVIETLKHGQYQLSLQLAAADESKPGPFRLSYLLGDDDVSTTLFAYPDEGVGGGYFALLCGPPAAVEGADDLTTPREVTIVIDRSGSMRGAMLEHAQTAALQILDDLEPDEWFNLIAYNETVDVFNDRSLPATGGNLGIARRWIEDLRPSGGTNIYDALAEAVRPAVARGSLPIVLFLTDGLPTIGQTSERAIRELALKGNHSHRRLFTFGVGVNVNTPLLHTLAADSRAYATFVLPGEDLELKVEQVAGALRGPVFAEPRLQPNHRIREVAPSDLPDLFSGQQLLVTGRYVGDDPLRLTLTGIDRGSEREIGLVFDLQQASVRNSFVPRLWASRRIAVLVDAIRQSGADGAEALADSQLDELVTEVVRLSTEFGILTEYTAFLALEGTRLHDMQALNLETEANLKRRAIATRSGAGSVNQELNLSRQMKQKTMNPRNTYTTQDLTETESTTVQQIADRTFYRRQQHWVDSRLITREAGKQTTVVEFDSPEFHQLVKQLTKTGRQGAVSLNGDILLEIDGRPVLVKAIQQ